VFILESANFCGSEWKARYIVTFKVTQVPCQMSTQAKQKTKTKTKFNCAQSKQCRSEFLSFRFTADPLRNLNTSVNLLPKIIATRGNVQTCNNYINDIDFKCNNLHNVKVNNLLQNTNLPIINSGRNQMRRGLKENKLHVPLSRIHPTSGSRLTNTARGYIPNTWRMTELYLWVKK